MYPSPARVEASGQAGLGCAVLRTFLRVMGTASDIPVGSIHRSDDVPRPASDEPCSSVSHTEMLLRSLQCGVVQQGCRVLPGLQHRQVSDGALHNCLGGGCTIGTWTSPALLRIGALFSGYGAVLRMVVSMGRTSV